MYQGDLRAPGLLINGRATFAHSLAEMRGIFIGETMTNDDFNKLLGITESYKMPDRLMEILTGDTVALFYDSFLVIQCV